MLELKLNHISKTDPSHYYQKKSAGRLRVNLKMQGQDQSQMWQKSNQPIGQDHNSCQVL